MPVDAVIVGDYLPKELVCWQPSASYYPQHASTCRDSSFLLAAAVLCIGFYLRERVGEHEREAKSN